MNPGNSVEGASAEKSFCFHDAAYTCYMQRHAAVVREEEILTF